MRITINREGCISCGACEAACPEVFILAEDGFSAIVERFRKGKMGYGEVGDELMECATKGKEVCPVQVISTEA